VTRACWVPVPLGPVGYPLAGHGYGGVLLVYLDSRDHCLCASCANDPDCELGPAVLVGAHISGPAIDCDGCGETIESYYGAE
jgi:hypothetical protein